MEKVIKVDEKLGEATLNLVSGQKKIVKTKTTYTYYDSGRKDCHVDILKSLDLLGESKIKGDK